MKRIIHRILICAIALPIFATAATAQTVSPDDLLSADRLLFEDKYDQCLESLERLLAGNPQGRERAEVLWRLSRMSLILGQEEKTNEGKRAVFGKGVEYAEEAIRLDADNPDCYMWHSGNVGRECETRSLVQQIKALPKMMSDLGAILDKLGKTDYSPAWQALAEIYFKDPRKSDDAAINYIRKAALTIPKGEIRLSTYVLMAKMLYGRNDSAEERTSNIKKNAADFAKAHKSNIDKFAFFDGSLGENYTAPWSTKPIGTISDREEAKDLAAYVQKLYDGKKTHSRTDESDLKDLKVAMSKWK